MATILQATLEEMLPEVGAVQYTPLHPAVDPQRLRLKAPPGSATQPLNLKRDTLVSNAFAASNASTCVPPLRPGVAPRTASEQAGPRWGAAS
jgi:hypothetical protein